MPVTLYNPYPTADARKAPVVVIRKKTPPFQKAKGVQSFYERALRGVSREIGKLIKGYNPVDLESVERLKKALNAYAQLIDPWANYVVGRVLKDIVNQDARSWRAHTKEMSLALREAITNAPVGQTMQDLMQQNVTLIKSIPIDAAEHVHKIVTENLIQGRRPDNLIEELMKTEDLTRNRATLIARTETARAASTFTQARAQHVGSDSYIWRTSRDTLVRKSHREVNGHEFKWDSPPQLSDGSVCHPGTIYNCRCYPEPILPDV